MSEVEAAATGLSMIEVIGAWLSIFLTLCVLSYLYDDNPIYKAAEHLYLGISVGYGAVEIFFNTFQPKLIEPLARIADDPGNLGLWTYLVPLAMVGLLSTKISRRYSYLARVPIAFLVAAYAGTKLTGQASGNLLAQVSRTITDLGQVYHQYGLWSWAADGQGLISSLVVLLGLISCLVYFYFSSEHRGVIGKISRVGVVMLMISFGASFGFTVMGRLSLAIGRFQELLGHSRSAEEAAQIQPLMATVLLSAGIIIYLIKWREAGGGHTPEDDDDDDIEEAAAEAA